MHSFKLWMDKNPKLKKHLTNQCWMLHISLKKAYHLCILFIQFSDFADYTLCSIAFLFAQCLYKQQCNKGMPIWIVVYLYNIELDNIYLYKIVLDNIESDIVVQDSVGHYIYIYIYIYIKKIFWPL